MASRFVVVLALCAVCQASPVDELRGKRSYTAAIGTSIGYGKNSARAETIGNKADAQAANDYEGIARDALGNGLPSQAYAKVHTQDTPSEAVLGYAQPAYYPLPPPATVVTYQKYAEVPAEIPSPIVYDVVQAPGSAQSSALVQGYGSANSNADTRSGSAVSGANAQGIGHSIATSSAQNNGPVVIAEPVVVAAKGIHSVYTPVYTPVGHNSASSSANVNGYGSANSAARAGGAVPTRKSISWRFGTAYDQPAAYGAANLASAAARSDVPYGSLSSVANSHGDSNAQSYAINNAHGSSVRSGTVSHGGGYSAANANSNNANNAFIRSDNGQYGYGAIKSYANAQNGGSSISGASTDLSGNEYVNSAANSNGGSAQSGARSDGGAFGVRSNGAWGGKAANSYAIGHGNAASSVRSQGLSTGYKVVNANANSAHSGSAYSNAFA